MASNGTVPILQVSLVAAPSPVNLEPRAPPVAQRRISARDAKLVEGGAGGEPLR